MMISIYDALLAYRLGSSATTVELQRPYAPAIHIDFDVFKLVKDKLGYKQEASDLTHELYDKETPPPTKRTMNAILSVDPISDDAIENAVEAFTKTVEDIEVARESHIWPAAAPGKIREQECTICDLRWDCPTGKPDIFRYP